MQGETSASLRSRHVVAGIALQAPPGRSARRARLIEVDVAKTRRARVAKKRSVRVAENAPCRPKRLAYRLHEKRSHRLPPFARLSSEFSCGHGKDEKDASGRVRPICPSLSLRYSPNCATKFGFERAFRSHAMLPYLRIWRSSRNRRRSCANLLNLPPAFFRVCSCGGVSPLSPWQMRSKGST